MIAHVEVNNSWQAAGSWLGLIKVHLLVCKYLANKGNLFVQLLDKKHLY